MQLIKAIRFQTVDILEDIEAWQVMQVNQRPFFFRGVNYVSKISSDMSHLDSYPELTEHFDFKFTGNPLTYNGNLGVRRMQGPFGSASLSHVDSFEKSGIYDPSPSVDGVDILRLKHAQRIIQVLPRL